MSVIAPVILLTEVRGPGEEENTMIALFQYLILCMYLSFCASLERLQYSGSLQLTGER